MSSVTNKPKSVTTKAQNQKDAVADITSRYKTLSDRDHVLLRPEMYMGSCSISEETRFICNGPNIEAKQIGMIPGLYKLYDEALVNARDHVMRCACCRHCPVHVDAFFACACCSPGLTAV
jgi:DNA topoisomerase-2